MTAQHQVHVIWHDLGFVANCKSVGKFTAGNDFDIPRFGQSPQWAIVISRYELDLQSGMPFTENPQFFVSGF